MKIAFVGKGGSGKTTLSSLFIRHLLEQQLPVIGVDADINQHLCHAIGVKSPQKELGLFQDELKRVLAGKNKRIDPKSMIKTTPPGLGSVIFTTPQDLQQALPEFCSQKGSGLFLTTGQQTKDDAGIRCYHSKTGAVELLLNHYVDEKEYIVVDMTAGADAFASGLFDKFDLTVLVVEPTKKSTEVFFQYAQQANELGVVVKAIGNKAMTKADEDYLKELLGEELIDIFSQSQFVRSEERGDMLSFDLLESRNKEVLNNIQFLLEGIEKDWGRYLSRTIELHKKNAQSWGNSAKGKDLTEQIDPTFSYT